MKKTLLSVLTALSMVSAQANIFQYSVTLDGPSEPTSSLGTGSATVNYDDVSHLLQMQVTFSGLTVAGSTGTSASHIHAATVDPFTGTAGVATQNPLIGFPTGVYSGSFSNTFDLTLASSWNGAYITANGGTPGGAETAFANAMATGRAYWNIHSSLFPGGEIRGFLTPVPEPSSLALVGLSALGLAARVWSKRRTNRQ